MKIKLKEGLTNPYEKNSKGLADKILGWYDFDTDYIDDGGQRRSAERRNDSVVEWFGEHPIEIRKDAFKLIKSKVSTWGANYVSRFERNFGKHIKEAIKSIKENVSIEAISIAQYTGTRKDAVQSFIDTHKLNAKKLLSYVAKGKMKERMDFVSAIAGKEGNPIQKKIIKMFEVANTSYGETVKEAKYPTDLKIGSVILGQGFTMLKGIEGGNYYKVVDMDDTSATLVPSDKNGNVKGSKKVRHKLSSIDGGIKTAKRGDENGIVVIKEAVNEVTVTRIPNFNLESDAYIFMLYLLKNNSGFKKAATDAGMALFSGANVKSVFTSLHNNLKKVITPQIVKAVVEKVNEKRTVIFVDSADIQNGVHTARFAGLLALGVVDSFINDPIDYKLINDLGNAKLKGLADEFSVGRGKIKLGVMMGNKGF
jgi:hypothetical protein